VTPWITNKAEVGSDPTKLIISEASTLILTISTLKINQGTQFSSVYLMQLFFFKLLMDNKTKHLGLDFQ